MVPFGFRFNPTDDELIRILERKVFQNACHLDFIVERDVYQLEPQYLQWDETVAANNGEKYYFCRRENDSREVAGRGWWKATSHLKTIYGSGRVLGYKRPLTFHKFKEDGRRRNNSLKTDWIMHEYCLEFEATEWRLCRIKYKGKLEGQDYEEHLQATNNSSNQSSGCGGGASSSQQFDFGGEWQQQNNFWPAVDQSPVEAFLSSDCGYFLDSIEQPPFPDLWD